MRRHVSWSQAARQDLRRQVAYIAMDDPAAARKVALRLRQAGNRLGEMAKGRKGRVTGTYEKPVRNLPYIIAYALTASDGHEAVIILRVIHAALDWPDEAWPA